MAKKIVTERGMVKHLSELFSCTPRSVQNALTYRSDTSMARKIRKAAMDRGGVEVEFGRR